MNSQSISLTPRRLRDVEMEKRIRSQITNVISNDFTNKSVDPRKNLHLDTNKLAYHEKRVAAWRSGVRVAPVTIDMALTQKCMFVWCF